MKSTVTCNQARDLLDEATDQSSVSSLRDLRAHLETCAACREESVQLAELRQRVGELNREIEPSRDLWTGIRRQIERKPTGARFSDFQRGFQLAAGVLLVAGATVVAVFLRDSAVDLGTDPGTTGPLSTANTTLKEPLSPANAADLAHLEDHMLSTRRDMLIAVAQQEGQIDDEFEATLAKNVEDLNLAIGEIRLALSDSPENSRLNLLLAAKFQQEAALLKRLKRI